MEANKSIPKVGKHLRDIANVLGVLSMIALWITIIVWINALTHSTDVYGSFEHNALSGLQAFGYILYSLEAMIASFVLRGFSYVVIAAISYLNEKGEFGEKE